MKKEHKSSISYSDKLCFPENLTERCIDGLFIIISQNTANWIVLDEDEYKCFKIIRNNEYIKNTILSIDKDKIYYFNKLLGKIFQRKFAGINITPEIKIKKERSAYFSLTNLCNLQCKHCYISAGKNITYEISAKKWMDVAEEFAQSDGSFVTLTGGEILLKNKWSDIVKKIHSLGLKQTLLTNGTLWTETDIKEIAQYVDEVQISLDGIDEQSNAKIRGAGNFELALTTIKKFDQLGIRTSVAMTPLPEHLEEFSDGFMYFFNRHIQGTNIKIRLSKKILPLRDGISILAHMQENYSKKMNDLSNKIYPNAENVFFSLAHQPNEGMDNCGLGGITIDAYGYAHPCNRFTEFIRTCSCEIQSLKEISHSLEVFSSFFSVDNIEECRKCDLRYICGGGCRLDEHEIIHNEKGISIKTINDNMCTQRKHPCTKISKNALLKKMINMSRFMYG